MDQTAKPASTDSRNRIRQAWRSSAGGLVAIIIFGAFINVLKFAMPLYTLQILDRIPASRSVETLVMLTGIALMAVVAGVSLEAVRRRMLSRWGAWIERQFGPGQLHVGISNDGNSSRQALKDLATLRGFVGGSATAWLDVVWAPVFVVAVYLVHPFLGWILMAAIAVLLIFGVLQDRMTRAARRASGHASNFAETVVTAAERNRETVVAHGMASNLAGIWHDKITESQNERDRADARAALFTTLIQGLYRCLYVGGLCIGILLVISDELTIGGVIAANIMLRFGFRLVSKPARRWRPLVNACRAYRRLAANLSNNETTTPSLAAEGPAANLVAENVSFRYPGKSDSVFRRIDISVAPGEMLCVIGRSGSGKSTLSRLLTGILAPRAGQVRFGDIEIRRLPAESMATLIGYLPESIQLLQGTIRQNIARMNAGNFDQVVEAAQLANIHDTIVRQPNGYDTTIGDDTLCLSRGERKRIGLARAFYGNPRLLILDEPEANLDRVSRKALLRAIETLKKQGAMIVVTSQSSRLGKHADQVLLLGGGKAVMRSIDEDTTDRPDSDKDENSIVEIDQNEVD